MNKFISAINHFGNFISIWKQGFFNLIVVLLIGVAGPAIIAIVLSAIILIPPLLLGFDAELPYNYGYKAILLGISILGPYFIGKEWDIINDTCKKISQGKDKI